ncbi:MAG: sugar ABC transporter permease [Geobacter sp.]|nr:MAG: sugar ABC transporter permease [Geobacter sp.]
MTLFKTLHSFHTNRNLIWQMTKREVVGRYRGSALGLLWSFFNPILMLVIYTFVFSVVFKSRWGTGEQSKFEFALILFAGMIVFNLFAECINRAPTLIVGNVNYVKKVVFPLEILPLVYMGAALFHGIVSLSVLVIFNLFASASLPWTMVFAPVVMLPLLLMTLGVSWFLASFGVFVRDVAQSIGVLTTILMFLTPIFYPVSAIPEKFRIFIYMNPLTFVVEQMRAILIWGKLPSWSGWGLSMMFALLVAWVGLVWFQKTRKGFADVL